MTDVELSPATSASLETMAATVSGDAALPAKWRQTIAALIEDSLTGWSCRRRQRRAAGRRPRQRQRRPRPRARRRAPAGALHAGGPLRAQLRVHPPRGRRDGAVERRGRRELRRAWAAEHQSMFDLVVSRNVRPVNVMAPAAAAARARGRVVVLDRREGRQGPRDHRSRCCDRPARRRDPAGAVDGQAALPVRVRGGLVVCNVPAISVRDAPARGVVRSTGTWAPSCVAAGTRWRTSPTRATRRGGCAERGEHAVALSDRMASGRCRRRRARGRADRGASTTSRPSATSTAPTSSATARPRPGACERTVAPHAGDGGALRRAPARRRRARGRQRDDPHRRDTSSARPRHPRPVPLLHDLPRPAAAVRRHDGRADRRRPTRSARSHRAERDELDRFVADVTCRATRRSATTGAGAQSSAGCA